VAIALGINKKLIAAKQSGLGVKASAVGAQYYARVTSDLNLTKDTFKSNQIQTSQQVRSSRHAMRHTGGTINDELLSGVHQEWNESLLRAAAVDGATTGVLTDVTASTDGAGTFTGTFTTAGGDFIADGFKVGAVYQQTGGTSNNDINFLITALTATVISVITLNKVDIVDEASGGSVTLTVEGMTIQVPESGHTADYWTFEEFNSDINQSKSFPDCVIGQADFNFPPNDSATVNYPIIGIGQMDTATSQYFTTPTEVSCGDALTATSGIVIIDGVKVGLITGIDFSVNGNTAELDGVVGDDVAPDVYRGKVEVTGNMSVYFQDATLRDLFINEVEAEIVVVMTADSTDSADFISYTFPRVKINGATEDDGEKGIIQSMPFEALENPLCGMPATSSYNSTIVIQDSTYV